MSTREARKRANRRHFEKHKEEIYARRRAKYHANKPVWTPEQREKRRAAVRKWMTKNQTGWKQRKREEMAGRPRPEFCDCCGGKGPLHYDHCHWCDIFRGWLCRRCNMTLGQVKDDPAILRKLIAYLERHSHSPTSSPSPPRAPG